MIVSIPTSVMTKIEFPANGGSVNLEYDSQTGKFVNRTDMISQVGFSYWSHGHKIL